MPSYLLILCCLLLLLSIFSRIGVFSNESALCSKWSFTVREWSRSVVSNSLWPQELQPTRLLSPWNFPGKSTGAIFPSLGALSDPGIEPGSHTSQADALPCESPRKPKVCQKWESHLLTVLCCNLVGGMLFFSSRIQVSQEQRMYLVFLYSYGFLQKSP